MEDELIASIEACMPEISRFCAELQEKAMGLAAAKAAKEEAQKAGLVGLGKVEKKRTTRPVSPNLSKPRLPVIPEPERIEQRVQAHEIPSNLNKLTLQDLEKKRLEDSETTRKKVNEKYGPQHEFRFNETKGGKKIEELRKEIEEERAKELQFDKKFGGSPPKFDRMPAKVAINTSSILREDYLFRQQQKQDALILKKYEEDLRDPTEYYSWQSAMREEDRIVRLQQVALRRELAKQSAEQAKEAVLRQQRDNKEVASLLREQGTHIQQAQKVAEEILQIQNQQAAQELAEARDRLPQEAKIRVLKQREEVGKEVRSQLAVMRENLEDEIQQEALIRADRIRQLRAENTVHRESIRVFDPTESSGLGFLDEMSYMEMKERLARLKLEQESQEINKRQDIEEQKRQRAEALEARAGNIQRVRAQRTKATQAYYQEKKNQLAQQQRQEEEAREAAAALLAQELSVHRQKKKEEKRLLQEEQERIKRQQQYLGAALGAVEEMRMDQQQRAQEREISTRQEDAKRSAKLEEESRNQDRCNRQVSKQRDMMEHALKMKAQEKQISSEKKVAIEKLKTEQIFKKTQVREGHVQHEKTKTVTIEHNPYANRISQEVHEHSQAFQSLRTQRRVSST